MKPSRPGRKPITAVLSLGSAAFAIATAALLTSFSSTRAAQPAQVVETSQHTKSESASATAAAVSTNTSVKIEDLPDAILVTNSEISVRFDKKTGRLISLKRGKLELLGAKGYGYLQFYASGGAASERGKKLTEQEVGEKPTVRVVRNEPDLVDVAVGSQLSGFDVEIHYVVREGESGFYNYIVVRNDPSSPAGDRALEQVNFCLRADPEIFRYATIGDEKHGYLPRPEDMHDDQKVMDASYRLPNGVVDAKYDWTLEETGGRVFGLMSDNIGLFLVKDSGEALNSAPVARELTVHQTTTTPVLLRHFTAAHYGRGNIKLTAADGKWAKLAGPWFVYVAEGKSHEELWTKAQARAAEAVRDWPYQWMRDPLYPLGRGTVTGRIEINNGSTKDHATTSVEGSLVFIGPTPTAADPDWQKTGKGFFFWSRVNADGTFEIAKARAGNYSIWVLNDGQFGEYRQDNVIVKAGAATDLGTLKWQPEVVGKIIWQIGKPDRTSSEFRHGDDYRHWGLWLKYPEEFPHDVDFKIGLSNDRTDWNYLQPAVKNSDGSWRLPEWKIRFDHQKTTAGQARLRIDVAGVSAHAGETTGQERWAGFEVRLNGELIQTFKYPNDSGSSRSSNRGVHHPAIIDFDASKLKVGENVISLTLTSPPPTGIAHDFPYCGVMYDAIRLEIEDR